MSMTTDAEYENLFANAQLAGFSKSAAQAIVGAVREADECAAYETEHVDAAREYDVLLSERYDIPFYAIDCFFSCGDITYDSVRDTESQESTPSYTVAHVAYLGQSEIEHQSAYELSDAQIDFVEHNSSWTINSGLGSQLWYTTYPDNLHVLAYVDSEYADRIQD